MIQNFRRDCPSFIPRDLHMGISTYLHGGQPRSPQYDQDVHGNSPSFVPRDLHE